MMACFFFAAILLQGAYLWITQVWIRKAAKWSRLHVSIRRSVIRYDIENMKENAMNVRASDACHFLTYVTIKKIKHKESRTSSSSFCNKKCKKKLEYLEQLIRYNCLQKKWGKNKNNDNNKITFVLVQPYNLFCRSYVKETRWKNWSKVRILTSSSM